MNITIIGTGNMAKAISTRFLVAGHNVCLHAQDMVEGLKVIDTLKTTAQQSAKITVKSVGSKTEEIVILAIPYAAMRDAATAYPDLSGKIVVDISNPVDFKSFELVSPPDLSAAEEIATLYNGAYVIKAFNTTFAGTLRVGKVKAMPLDVFMAGDDAAAKDRLGMLIKSCGLRVLDVGPLRYARHLESMGFLHIKLQNQLGTNWMSALKIIG